MGLTLTDKYLAHLLTEKKETTPEVKEFVRWVHELQKSQPTGGGKFSQRTSDPKFNSRHEANAKEILERCGNLERAKAAARYAVETRKKAARTIHDLKKVIYQRDFMPEFEAVEAGAPVKRSPAMEEATLKRLLDEARFASDRRNSSITARNDPSHPDSVAAVAANATAAHQAMKMGTPPSELWPKYHIWGGEKEWGEIYDKT